MMMKAVAEERNGWRDERISKRHRQWGRDCPAVDIDFLMLEYDRDREMSGELLNQLV